MHDFSRYLNIRSATCPVPTADEKAVVFLSDITGNFQVWRMGLRGQTTYSKSWPKQLTFFEDKVWGIHGTAAANHILAVGDVGGNERQQFYLITQEGTDSHDVRRLTTNDEAIHRFGMWSQDGQQVVYTSNARNGVDFDVYQLDIVSGESQLLCESMGNRVIAGWSPDRTQLLLLEAVSSLQHELYLLDIESGEERHVTADAPPARYEQIRWVDSGIYTITDREDDCGALCYLYPSNAALRTIVDSTIEEGAGELDLFTIASDGRSAALTYNADGYSHLYLLDLEDFSQEYNLRACTDVGEGVISSLKFGRSSRYLFFERQTPRHNANIWRQDCLKPDEFLSCEPLTFSDGVGIPSESFVLPEVIRYPSFDELEIPALYYRPKQEPPQGGYPCILYVHGGPASQLRPEFDVRFHYFLAHGYAILATNVRGSTGYGRAYTALDELELRMDSVADLKYAVHWLHKQDEIDSERIAIYGRSYGGYMVLAALTEYPELFAAGIDVVGIANWVTFMERTSPWRRPHREKEYGSLEHQRDLLERISPIHKIEQIQVPLMVLAGDNDPLAPPTHQAAPCHPKRPAYRCCLPTLTGFTVFCRTGPST